MSSSRSVLAMRQKKEGEIGRKTIQGVFIIVYLFALVFTAPQIVFAGPPDSPYAPGETLNPSCSPGASNCTVEQIYVATTTLNYGIGSTSPLARLTVSATSSLSSFDLFRVEAVPSAGATSTALIVTSSGRVGVGTTSPYATFGVEMTTTNPAFVISNNGSSTPALYVGGVNQNGFIGIGTTSPSTPSDKLALYGGSFFQSVASTTGPYASDQTGMRVVGTLGSLGVTIVDSKVVGRYLYIVDDTNDIFQIIDVGDPTFPRSVSTTSLPFSASKSEIEILGHYAYITPTTGSGVVIDIANPSSPRIVVRSSILRGGNHAFTASGMYAYIATGATLDVIDISDPTSLRLISRSALAEGINATMDISGNYAYIIGTGNDFFEVVDISNPSAPASIATLSLPAGGPNDVKVQGRNAYVVDITGKYLKVIDIANPSSPQVVGTINLTEATNVSVNGRYAYVLGPTALTVVDVASSTNPINVASMAGSDFRSIVVSGRYAYTIDNGTLKVIDVSGIEVQSALVHSLEAGSLQTRGNASIAGMLNVTGSSIFGGSTLFQGGGAFSLSSTTSLSAITALSASISDTNNSSIVDIANLSHTSTSTSGATVPAAGIGSGLLFSIADSSWLATSTSRIASILTNVSDSAPASALTFSNKNTTGSLSEFMRLDSSGRLGIGTTSPYAKLSVAGEVAAQNFTATSTTATSTFMGGVGVGTTTPSAPLSVSGNAYFASNVGIGIASPRYLVDAVRNDGVNATVNIEHTGSNGPRLRMKVTDAALDASILMTPDDVNHWVVGFDNDEADSFKISYNSDATVQNGNVVTFMTTGNVGVGTSSPYAKLSVAGEVVGANFTATSTTATSSFSGGATLSTASGNVGIGTSSPWRKLSVTGTVGIEGLTSNSAANAVCILANNEITTAGGAVCNGVSSQRFKHDITNSNLGLSAILAMRPVSFRYKQGFGDSGKAEQFGLIAEEAYQIDSRLAVIDNEGLPTTVRYDFLAPILIKAVQELNLKIETFASTSVTSTQNQTSLLGSFMDWAGNSIQAVRGFFDKVETKELCVEDVCVTREAFKAVFGSGVSPDSNLESPISDIVPPVITIIGNNPAEIEKGTSYLDLGATVTDNVSTNLGINVTGDHIDTTILGTSTIIYTATDGAGNTATSTRTVIVTEREGASEPEVVLSEPVSSTTPVVISEAATSTANGE